MPSDVENETEAVATVVMAGAVASGVAVIVASAVVVVEADAFTNSTKSPSLEIPVEKISSTPEATSNSLIEAEVGERGGGKERRNVRICQRREHIEALRVKLLKGTK